jgi:hypothetical protein
MPHLSVRPILIYGLGQKESIWEVSPAKARKIFARVQRFLNSGDGRLNAEHGAAELEQAVVVRLHDVVERLEKPRIFLNSWSHHLISLLGRNIFVGGGGSFCKNIHRYLRYSYFWRYFWTAGYMLQVTCYKLHVTSYMLQVTCCKLHVASYMLQVTCYKLHVTSYMLQVACYKLHVTSYMLKVEVLNFGIFRWFCTYCLFNTNSSIDMKIASTFASTRGQRKGLVKVYR